MVGTDSASIILHEYVTDTSSMLMQYVTYISPISHTERNNELPIKSCMFILCTLIFRQSIQTTDTVGSLMHMSSTCRKGGQDSGPIRGIVKNGSPNKVENFLLEMGRLTRQRPLSQVGKCENPLHIYSQTSTNVHLSRLTANSEKTHFSPIPLYWTDLRLKHKNG